MPVPRAQAAAILAAAALLAAAAPPASAQPASLLADVSDRPIDHGLRSVLPPGAVLLDGIVYFAHDDGVAGHELWRSDGTAAGTWRVRDVCPGRCWGFVLGLTVAGGRLYFEAEDGVHGRELWTSDGTTAGTRLVADLAPGLRNSRPEWITALGDLVFFSADDGIHGREPWISDGTAAGTVPLGDLRAGAATSFPSDSVELDGGVLFFADDGVHGREPWFTDGTAAGTAMIVDIRPGAASSVGRGQELLRYPSTIAFDGRAWFGADDGVLGNEPWFSDGTAAGTALAADVAAGAAGSGPDHFMSTPTRLFFRAHDSPVGDELYSTDGTATGLVADIHPGSESAHPLPIGALGEKLFFVASTAEVGQEIWTSDGTPGGTELLIDLAPGPESGAPTAWAWPASAVGDQLFFGTGHAFFETELWRTDGTADGTRQVTEIWPGPGAGLPVFFGTFAPPVALDGRLFFFAAHPELGWEPWLSDGTDEGTHAVRDIYTTPSSQVPFFFDFDSSFPIDAGGRLYFAATNWTTLTEPWTSRGTPQSTRQVAETVDGPRGGYAWPVAPLGTRLILFVRAGDQEELWVTEADGSGAELLSVVDWSGGFGSSLAGRAFFDVTEGRQSHLWVSDGTPGGTGRFVDQPRFEGGWPAPFAELDGRLYFLGEGNLWSTDGVPGGTARVSDLDTATTVLTPPLVASGDQLFFPVDSPEAGKELWAWASDGSRQGTVPLPEVRPGPEPGFVDRSLPGVARNITLVPVAGGVAFVGDDGVRGEEPWWSDGSGVAAIGDLRPGARGSEPRWLTSTGGTLFFAADDGVHGRELWRWRPGETAAMVADLVPGEGSSVPQELTGVDGLLYFSAFTPERGVELWRSGGTAAGTVLVQDVWPGEESSTPSRPTASGRYLFFTADDGEHGREMWSLLLPTRRPRAFLTTDGGLVPNGRVVLTLRLENPPPEEMPDGEGHELVLPLPEILELIEWTATSGTVAVQETAPAAAAQAAAGPRRSAAAAAGGALVTWNGSLPPGGSVEIVLVARVRSTAAAPLHLQATGAFDSDGDGSNDEPLASDDPRLPGEDDATVLALVLEIPTLGAGALAVLAGVLALLALHRLRNPVAG